MTAPLEQRREACDAHYVLDNELTMQWHPQRVVALASGSSMIQLEIGPGFTINYFAGHFSPNRVIGGSPEVSDRALLKSLLIL